MEILFYLIGGFLGGFIFAWIYDISHRTYGKINIDHNTDQLTVHITSDDLKNRKIKKVIFSINHDAHISQDKQLL